MRNHFWHVVPRQLYYIYTPRNISYENNKSSPDRNRFSISVIIAIRRGRRWFWIYRRDRKFGQKPDQCTRGDYPETKVTEL